MNPFLLWAPGVGLIIAGAVLLATGTVHGHSALALVGIGAAVETVGGLLWLRGRSARKPRR